MHILTVGDGDLSLSLALSRAYPQHELTASVLVESKSELLRIYPEATHAVRELRERRTKILWGVDATQLHTLIEPQTFDYVLFHHPHLGSDFDSEQAQAEQHRILLSHYFHSAAQVSRHVHVCLCQSQATTWKLTESAERLHLELQEPIVTTRPLFENPTNSQQGWAAPRRYRNGQTGSRHVLGKYGYRHRRTHGHWAARAANDTNVKGSMHYTLKSSSPVPPLKAASPLACPVCECLFPDDEALQAHLRRPAVPLPVNSTILLDSREAHHSSMTTPPKPRPLKADAEGIFTVDEAHANVRLRCFVQQHTDTSKNEAKHWIKEGFVSIDGKVVTDAARLLHVGMRVSVQARPSGAISSLSLDIRWKSPTGHVVVVHKPVGVRTKGIFDGTLEHAFQTRFGQKYTCLSKLDKGCTGLCVFSDSSRQFEVEHTFTALVYGSDVKDVDNAVLPVDQLRKWKRKVPARDQATVHDDAVPIYRNNGARICVVAEATEGVALTTLSVSTRSTTPSPASVLCHFLRSHLNCPLVGDKFATNEYLGLPRAMRNRLKERLCLGCTRVVVCDTADRKLKKVEMEVPDKWNALFWQDFYFGGSTRGLHAAATTRTGSIENNE